MYSGLIFIALCALAVIRVIYSPDKPEQADKPLPVDWKHEFKD